MAEFPDDPEVQFNLARSRVLLTHVFIHSGRTEPAQNFQALDLLEQLTLSYPENPKYRQALAESYRNVAYFHERMVEDFAAAIALTKALENYQVLAQAHPNVANFRGMVARVCSHLGGSYLDTNRPAEAEKFVRNSLFICEELGREDHAKMKDLQPIVAQNYVHLGKICFLLKRATESRSYLEKALALSQQLVTENPKVSYFAEACTAARSHLVRHGLAEEIRLTWKKVLEQNPPVHEIWFGYAELCLFLGKEDEYRRARTALLGRFSTSTDPLVAERTGRACLLLPSSEEELNEATVLIDRTIAAGQDHWAYHHFVFAKGLAQYRHGRFDKAVALLETVALKPLGVELKPIRGLVLAMAQHQQGKKAEARNTFEATISEFDWDLASADRNNLWICHVLRREAEKLLHSK